MAGRPLPGIAEANAAEPMMVPAEEVAPRLRFGCSVAEAFGPWPGSGVPSDGGAAADGGSGSAAGAEIGGAADGSGYGSRGSAASAGLQPAVLRAVFDLYAEEHYVLIWRDGRGCVLLKEGYEASACLRAVWQAAWLERHCSVGAAGGSRSDSGTAGSSGSSNGSSDGSGSGSSGAGSSSDGSSSDGSSSLGREGSASSSSFPVTTSVPEYSASRHLDVDALEASLEALRRGFPEFISEAEALRWHTDSVVLKPAAFTISVGRHV